MAAAGGGATWLHMQQAQCSTTLRQPRAVEPSELPRTGDVRIVYLTATRAVTCADNTVTLTPLAITVIVSRDADAWRVSRVHH